VKRQNFDIGKQQSSQKNKIKNDGDKVISALEVNIVKRQHTLRSITS